MLIRVNPNYEALGYSVIIYIEWYEFWNESNLSKRIESTQFDFY